MKRICFLCITCMVLILSSCMGGSLENSNNACATTKITIPNSYFQYTGGNKDETVSNYQKYCTSAQLVGEDVVIEVTEQQKRKIVDLNTEFIGDILGRFEESNENYGYEFSDDYKEIVYKYDDTIDNDLQAEVIFGATFIHVLNGILETGDGNWNLKLIIQNCHTEKIVAEAEFPGNTLSFGAEEWEESYNE